MVPSTTGHFCHNRGPINGVQVTRINQTGSGQEGCQAVVDFVGSDESLALAASIVSTKGIVALLGLAGGHLSYGFDTLPPEVTVTTVVAGTIGDLHDVVRLAQEEPFLMPLVTYALEDVEQALFALRTGQIAGRAVLVPN